MEAFKFNQNTGLMSSYPKLDEATKGPNGVAPVWAPSAE
ncbi:hypothetical protein FTUN_2689 [Frigoriglobus tundricola]|uniref:Uncharacterized protein n=1 Tax=Frigoriglobus tundricola TaxID=2774151 RepID=A0A6M5YP42_9BACT|nr:hypothetical protein FTUN_2689 [Frigoriglobus tundricola]